MRREPQLVQLEAAIQSLSADAASNKAAASLPGSEGDVVGIGSVERSDRSDTVVEGRLGEARAELDETLGKDGLWIERSVVGPVADEIRMDGGECERGQLDELLEGDEDRELGGGDKLVRRGRGSQCRAWRRSATTRRRSTMPRSLARCLARCSR